MAENFPPTMIGFFILVVVWLAGLTYTVLRSVSHYNKLVAHTGKKGLQEVFENVIRESKKNQEQVHVLTRRVESHERKAALTIQKVSLIRFNPFSNTGGEQSFIVALLDQNNSGIVFTSLQGRTGTRWYAKQIKKSKGVDFELSKEEEEAIQKAKPLD